MKPCLQFAPILILAFFSMSFIRPDDGMVRGRRAVNTLLDSVEFTMDDNPAHADSLIKQIDPNSIKAKRQKARYALLYTAAEYKNYQPFTSDSLIMEAVNFYANRHNYDYRFLSYYYLGCVYMEMNLLKDASVAFAHAEWLVDRIENEFWKGLLYLRLGEIFAASSDFNKNEEYNLRAVACFERAGKNKHRLNALFNVGEALFGKLKFIEADSVYQIVEKECSSQDYYLQGNCIYSRLISYLHMENIDSAKALVGNNHILFDKPINTFAYYGMMALYYDKIKDYSKTDSCLDEAKKYIYNLSDSIYWYYYNYEISNDRNQIEVAFENLKNLYLLQNIENRSILNEPFLHAQHDLYRSITEIETVKSRNKITILIASVIIFFLLVLTITIYSRNKRLEYENQLRDYIATINELTTQISIHKDKIGNLNGKVREMLRQQFDTSDYLYTRYYEQIDDNKKAERIYRVVKNQLEGFTNHKNISRIDELLDEAFDGIMIKLSSSGLEIKEKDMLLLRFALAGFSAKSIAAILDDTHQNINQRKKRMLDKIQVKAPHLMEELRNALNDK